MEATTLIDSFRVDGKVAVVTGAGSGIGRASAMALAGAGATVVCADIQGETAKATAADILSHGGAASGVAIDVSVRTDVDELAGQVVEEHGGIHVWCNIAGIMVEGPFLDAPEEDLDRILSVNLKGVFFGCQAAGRIMVTQPEGGSIINASSAAADTPSANIVSYAICKAGVVQMTKSLAVRGRQEACPGQRRRPRLRPHRHDRSILRSSRRHRGRGHAGGGPGPDAQVHTPPRRSASPRTSPPPCSIWPPMPPVS